VKGDEEMKEYKENPKTKGSGILCCIPQTGLCPNKCEDCFFQSGRSYLEPLADNLPNMPPVPDTIRRIIRVNDGNDSNVQMDTVMEETQLYSMRFYNTAIPKSIDQFNAPVVLTLNPGTMTDDDFHKVDTTNNLMFVRFRTNMWNLPMLREAVHYYGEREIPIILTFMAYYDERSIPSLYRPHYTFRKRTLNSYHAITTASWRTVMKYWQDSKWEKWVYSCGKIEGENGITACRFCGNCLREYFATMERMRG
jgi:hypothetical protein